MAFRWAYDLVGDDPKKRSFVAKNDEVIAKGEVLKLDVSTGEVEGGASNDGTFAGIANEAIDNADDGLSIEVIVNPNGVYAVDDLNARVAGAKLDLASGGLGLTTDSNHDFVVIENSTATEQTYVMFNATHYLKR